MSHEHEAIDYRAEHQRLLGTVTYRNARDQAQSVVRGDLRHLWKAKWKFRKDYSTGGEDQVRDGYVLTQERSLESIERELVIKEDRHDIWPNGHSVPCQEHRGVISAEYLGEISNSAVMGYLSERSEKVLNIRFRDGKLTQ